MRSPTRWALTALLAFALVASLSLGMTSGGVRGLVLGLLVPGLIAGGIAVLSGPLIGVGTSVLAWLIGLELAGVVGSKLDGADAIDLWPLMAAVVLLLASCIGVLVALVLEGRQDRRPTGPRRRHESS